LLGELLVIVLAVAIILFFINYAGLVPFWVSLIVLVVGIFVAVILFFNWSRTIFRMTTRRVENKIGILGSREEEIALEDIQAVDLERSLIGTILNFGTVLIKAAGSNREVDFTNIANAKKISDKIEDMAMRNDGFKKTERNRRVSS